MYFESLDKKNELEICIGDYTDFPFKFKNELDGLNAIHCTVFYTYNDIEGMLFDELIWTYELKQLAKGLSKLMERQIDEFRLREEDEYLNLDIKRIDNDRFPVYVFVESYGDLKINTEIDTKALEEIRSELQFCAEICPEVKTKEEQYPLVIRYLNHCYNTNDFRFIADYLDDECEYTSQWAMDKITGKGKIAEYLIAKSETIKKTNSKVKSRLIRLKNYRPGVIALAIYQNNMEEISCIILLEEDKSLDTITKYEICIPDLFEYEFIRKDDGE